MDTNSSSSPHRDDSDSIWGSNDEVPAQEWSKMDEDFTNAGYREGITAGKESALQEGFDDGFANVGAPLGREIGILRGTANAVMNLLSPSASRARGPPEDIEKWRAEIREIMGGLGRIYLADLAPRDMQAEEHAREHLDSDAAGDTHSLQSVEYRSTLNDVTAPKPAVEDLNRLRVRLSTILQNLAFDISLD